MARTADAARGKWRGILLQLGVDASFLRDKHGPCPFCQGRDRYRWDNKRGDGSFICSQCGAGDGFEFLRRLKGWDFATAAKEIDQVVGNISSDPAKRILPDADRKRLLGELWLSGKTVVFGDPVATYLNNRGVELPQNLDCLRYVERCPVPNESGRRPAMVAAVHDRAGKGVTLHRTFLTPRGSKADMDEPRALMPGKIPDGCAIRLAHHEGVLGIAEGIETALAATKRFGLPVWAAVNATMLAKWLPPEGVNEVVVFGDNDASFTGQAAAWGLAKKLKSRGINVRVQIPVTENCDWADAYAA